MMDPTFEDLIPAPQSGGPPGGNVDFHDLIPNQDAWWQPPSVNGEGRYFGQTIGSVFTGQDLKQNQQTWGGANWPEALPNGRALGEHNVASDSSSEQRAYGADSGGETTYRNDPEQRSAAAERGSAERGSPRVGVPGNVNLPFNVRAVPVLDWSLGPIGVTQALSFPFQPAPKSSGVLVAEASRQQQSAGVFTLLTANQRLKGDGVVTSDRYDSDGALVRDFLDANTGEVIGSASPYNGVGLQQLSDGLTFVRYDDGGTSPAATGVTNAEFVATNLYDRTAKDWWDAFKRNDQQVFANGKEFNKLSRLRAYDMLNAISSALGNRYVDSGMFNLNSIAMIGGLLPTDNWSASAMRHALAAPQEGAGVGYRFSGGLGYEPPGPSGLNRYGGFLPAEALSHLTLPSQLPADFDTNSPIGRFAWLPYAKPGNTLGGEYAHEWIGKLFERAAPTYAISELNTAPGSRGVDINVDPRSVSSVGFRYGEIKPLSPYGIRSYNEQVRNWNLPDPVQAISYDRDGNIYLGFRR